MMLVRGRDVIGGGRRMKFRKFMLVDYLNGESGQNCWTFFSHFKEEFENRNSGSKFYSFVTGLVNGEGYAKPAFDLRWKADCGGATFGSFDAFYDDMRTSFPDQEEARTAQGLLPLFSAQLFVQYPDYAVPYLIPRHFYKLEIICREFGIRIPQLPAKNDHVARFNYYFDLCRALRDFRIQCEMSPIELCVFLYGYAMRFVDDIVQNSACRNPMIFVLLASPEDRDLFLSKELDADEITVWQGRPEMMPGDVVLMYERSPRSCFSSIWRVVTPGFDEPFDPNSGKVFIGEHVNIPPIPFKEFSKDVVWSKNSLIPAHMQNGAGRACSVQEYQALIDMIKTKDPAFDVSRLPDVPMENDYVQEGLTVEHDVEVKLLEPFLVQLGFESRDWVTQFIMRIGRENTSRPDYVVYLDETGSTPMAQYVFEAKLTIPTKRQLKKDHGQAVTYGNLLQSSAVALIAREGVWVSRREDKFDFEKINYYSWTKIKEPEVMAGLRQIFNTHK